MSDQRETELERAIREANEAEAKLRALKERLIDREHVKALDELLAHELAAALQRVGAEFVPRFVEASRGTDADRKETFAAYQAAMLAAGKKVFAMIHEQTAAWTLAAIEDREREDGARGGLP